MTQWNGYRFAVEKAHENRNELLPLYRMHYAEMRSRLAGEGVDIPDFAPRYDEYIKASVAGYLVNYTVRKDGKPVGYANVYVTNDMHNGEFFSQEDTIFVHPDHRRGVGKKLMEFGLNDLARRGVRSLRVTALTDPRIVTLWQRMGFKPVGVCMVYRFN